MLTFNWDRAFEECMKKERQCILDMLEQGDTPEQIIEGYTEYDVSVVKAVMEDILNENK